MKRLTTITVEIWIPDMSTDGDANSLCGLMADRDLARKTAIFVGHFFSSKGIAVGDGGLKIEAHY